MDPDTCLREYYSAIERRDYDFADECWHDLKNWIGIGGFRPELWVDVQAEGHFWSKPHLKEQP